MKANHNISRLNFFFSMMYFNELRYNFESKSQRHGNSEGRSGDVFQWTKIQFWKQITTSQIWGLLSQMMYFNELRYNFESKSQPYNIYHTYIIDVFQWTKIQFWKQITTLYIVLTLTLMMYFNELRYNFESKSQLLGQLANYGIRCISMN